MAAAAAGLGAVTAQAQEAPVAPADARAYVQRAYELRDAAIRDGDQPFGAVVVRDGQIVGEGPSRVVTATDPTAHAEIEAIRDAARRLGTRDLTGCLMFSTSPPCRMCQAAAYWANLSGLYYGSIPTGLAAPSSA